MSTSRYHEGDPRRNSPEALLERAREHVAKARVRGDAESLIALALVAQVERQLVSARHVEYVAVVGRQCNELRHQIANLSHEDPRFQYLGPAEYAAKVREISAASPLRGETLMAWAKHQLEIAGYRLRTAERVAPSRRFSEERKIEVPPPPRPAPVTRDEMLSAISVRKVATPQYLSNLDYEELVEDVSADIMELPGNQLRGNSLRFEARKILGELGYHRRGE